MAKLPAVQEEMEQYFLEHKDQAAVGLELLPGVRELLTELKVQHRACAFTHAKSFSISVLASWREAGE